MPSHGDFRLVGDIDGFHHLIHFSANNKPAIYIYNSQLHLQETLELNFKLPENCDIRLIKLKDYYILYTHTQKTNKHQFLKISGNGTVSNISHILNNPGDSLWNRSTATFQLFDTGNNLVLTSLTYLNEIKKIRAAIIKPGLDSGGAVVNYLLFPFNTENEVLKEVTIKDNYLHVLKTSKNEEGNNTLTLYKLGLKNSKLFFRHFDIGKYTYQNPAIRFNADDSAIFVYAMIVMPPGYKGSSPSMFAARLDSALNETNPGKTIPDIFRGNTNSTFVVAGTKTAGWMTFVNDPIGINYIVPQPTNTSFINDYLNFDLSLNNTNSFSSYTYDNYLTRSYPFINFRSAVRLTTLNSRLERAKDSLVKNKGSYYQLHPSPYSQFVLHETPYLVLVQELVANKKGLIMIYPTENDKLGTVSLNVYNPYNFLLSLAQPGGDNYFIVPFTDKKEIGLMKVTLNN